MNFMQDLVSVSGDEPNQVYIHKSTSISGFSQYVGKQAGKAPSLLQLKILYYGLSKVCKTGCLNVRFSAGEFWRVNGVTALSKTHIQLLLNSVPDLLTRLTFKGIVDPVTGNSRIEIYSWVYKAVIEKTPEEGYVVELRFTPDLREDILLEDRAIVISLKSINRMSSKYGPRLYDMLLFSIAGHESITLTRSLDDLRAFLDATIVSRSVDLRKNVIEPAVRDVNTCTNLDVSFQMLKTGRSFTHVMFYIRKKDIIAPKIHSPDTKVVPASPSVTPINRLQELVLQQISYDVIASDMEARGRAEDITTLKLIVQIMAGVYANNGEQQPNYRFTMNGSTIIVSQEEVAARFQELNQFHVLGVIDNLKHYTKKINHPANFILACLYNAPRTMEVQEQSRFNEDWARNEAAEEESRRQDAFAQSLQEYMQQKDDFDS